MKTISELVIEVVTAKQHGDATAYKEARQELRTRFAELPIVKAANAARLKAKTNANASSEQKSVQSE